ncbi:MAG: DEAD/DEAH box helicase [Sulfuricurvum sp.]|jgi:transcription-repair coupling factor (superfamily II helicase)|uniref:DEAD/DEAH box helicase n=1 Tax=Sulfuricurvum sp. TaxID=2025608 RepID=UPI0025D0AB93|nr:DEAD/DEAH box helicase [Sulfuricurvum sp.]MCK9373031.1 DEAD/DEAH box helicase [Sulfuricurvum sp.]
MSQERFYEYLKAHGKKRCDIIICEDAKEASELADVARFLEIESIVFPDFRAMYLDDLRPFGEELFALFGALRRYYGSAKKPLVISPLKTLLYPLPNAKLLQSTTIEFASRIDLGSFKEMLHRWGYTFVDMVEMEGEVSHRGDIFDIFIPTHEHPYRISLFDDEVEEIKAFDVETQRTEKEELVSIEVTSAFFSLDEEQFNRFEKAIAAAQSDSFVKDIASLGLWVMGEEGVDFTDGKSVLRIREMKALLDESYGSNAPLLPRERLEAEVIPEALKYQPLIAPNLDMLRSVHKNKKFTLIAASDAQIKGAGIFDLQGLNVRKSGIVLNLVGPDEVIVSLNRHEKKRRRRKTTILLDDIKVGDYVVHEEYGVGIFDGVEQAEILGGIKDLVVIKYMGDDKLLLPVENLDTIDRYIASGSLPVLDRLGKGSFGKLKESVKARLFEIASEIVGVAASRALLKAAVITVDAGELKRFQAGAGFEYTPDQSSAIDSIVRDLRSGQIMDRLLSGDVGFGKTEVAMNAIFAAARGGYQSLLVVPTTLLSSQHYQSLKNRLAPFGLRIAKLDRFVSTKEKNAALKAFAAGELDCIVGTHALFGVSCSTLGVVIIDEEHKFGVKQKEKLKSLYENVHLLSMSATPIPRSLNQALSSIKTMSELLTPPSERLGVRTFVKNYDEKLIKEVILRELRRGGQVFYVHNSIDSMVIKSGELKAILPNLRILILHSKIGANETEEELAKFANREYDVLLATSIIESGIHMPTVNTMIIDGADRFGMADLHQLRGRVGRGHTEGYAYFIVDDKDNLTEEAKKRLVALESNSFLGSGSMLAYHDLEIRGGGNLVGDAQSGHIKNIGYSLYLRMLEDAIKILTNQTTAVRAKVDIKLTVSAFISDEVVSEDRLRLELYRRLSHCEAPSEIYEIEEEVGDRFGKSDTPTKQFFEIMVIKLLCIEKKIKMVSNYNQNITIEYQNGSKETLQSKSKDDDDLIGSVLHYLRTAKPKGF